ncbi:bifunctional hydroxymethylpyrimidine kinase/phosphomethylpyrimidine kinase [Agrococcus jejuensis]|uniref:bifunctional hydroxymethylpyrimidine kinase/phosphomethylpyrimidine kinase n=1 Tax=Agrococcus jejuensis TaxID=399736 RepID=UPI0011A2B632|nr:bifunctional hydroxymethylpyrimidine kinase/phosphomethylpyrimidine kinase [Agrococcus jejuensis]
MSRIPRVLSIAGSDPSGGAGIQADLKAIAAHGGYGMAVVTALTAQSTRGVVDVHVPPLPFLDAQLRTLSDDVAIDAVKIGMLASAPVVAVVERWLADVRPPLVVLDPVMVATSGDRLLASDAEDAIRRLCAAADLVTPNVPELAVLVGEPVAATWDAALAQARTLQQRTGAAVLLKGGHLDGATCLDAVVDVEGVHVVDGPRLAATSTHGTGCTLSSTMATFAAGGATWRTALDVAKPWLAAAIAAGESLEVGHGAGPVDHLHALRGAMPTSSWTSAAWDRTADVRADVDACAFVRGLGDGSLEPERFRWYLAQDALYLGEYARVLARASALAPTGDEQAFWARSAASAIEEEASLHRSHVDVVPDPAADTRAYVDHLQASAHGAYAEVVAAVLPCFWLYADVGARLAALDDAAHPFHDWLVAYGDAAFAEATRRAIAIADAAARDAGPTLRARMDAAFDRSMALELAFFEAPVRVSLHEPVLG